ncbi:hypothetical protein D3C86_1648790 [compost metagenome]
MPAASRAGVYTCNGCYAQVPNPDDATRAVLRREESRLNSPRPFNWNPQGLKVGDSMVVCNVAVCSEYIWRGGDNFDSGNIVSNILPPGASGTYTGGGGGSSNSRPVGNPFPGTGTGGNGGGTVTVGPISNPDGGGNGGGSTKKPIAEREQQ